MSRRRIARFVVRFAGVAAILGGSAVTLAGLSTYAVRSSRALPVNDAIGSVGELAEPQIANRAAKSGKLAELVKIALATTEAPTYSLASAPQTGDLDRFYNIVSAAAPLLANLDPALAIAPAEPEPVAAPEASVPTPKPAAVAVPQDKPKRVAPSPPPATGLLDDGQIAGLKGRLRLTSDQAEYWPAVESALRDVVRTQLRRAASKHAQQGGKINIDVNSAEVQKLIWAAMPLLMRLREDQKGEVRKLARVIGLEQVASQI